VQLRPVALPQSKDRRARLGNVSSDDRRPTGALGQRVIVKNGARFFLANEKGELIIAKFSRKGYEEISRTHLLEPTNTAAGRDVLWSHPAFANRCIYARNDKEILCASLAENMRRTIHAPRSFINKSLLSTGSPTCTRISDTTPSHGA